MIFTSSCCDNLSIDEIIERAEKGDCEAQYLLLGFIIIAIAQLILRTTKKPFYWLKLAAEQGHCEAQYSLGQKYTEDKSRHKDNEQAIFWLKKAALQGHTFRFPTPLAGHWIWRSPQL
ncbi:Sel1 domain-containing protein [Escherichia coli]|uniref:Sel1 domain-containing protein n=1 Tax=Escherichia coli TaxID=562 RepID=A0A2X1N2G5_ECOLX|nr:Sel1 domain-containing protein [Escherichia coli]